MDKVKKKPFYGRRLCVITAPALFLCVTFGVFIPVSLFLGNINEFLIPVSEVIPSVIIMIVLMGGVLGLTSLVIDSQNILERVGALVFSCAFGFYIQGNFLNPPFQVLNGTEIEWSSFHRYNVISCVCWICCFFVPQVLLSVKKNIANTGIKYISIFLSAVQLVTLVVLLLTTNKTIETDRIVTKEGEFDLSSSNNTVVFVVDTLDALWAENVWLNNEDCLSGLKDFTYFDNVVAGGAPTILGMPAIITGTHYDPKDTINDYYRQAFSESTLFEDIKKEGYSLKLFTLYSYLQGSKADLIDNVVKETYKVSSRLEFTKYLYRLGAFYSMPQPLKPFFWFYGDRMSTLIAARTGEGSLYTLNDPLFFEDLKSNGIKTHQGKPVFVLYHLFGAHGPYTMNEYAQRVPEGNTAEMKTAQILGSYYIIKEYLDEMKELGIYEGSTIIITADHGGTALYQNPAVFIKKPGLQDSLVTDSSKKTFKNLYASLAASVLPDHSAYGPDLFDHEEASGLRIHTAPKVLGVNMFPDNEMVAINDYAEYSIPDNARDSSAIHVIERSDLLNSFPVNPGEKIGFYELKQNNYIKDAGIDSDKSSVWSLGKSLPMRIELKDWAGDDITVKIRISGAIDQNQSIEVMVDGTKVASFEYKDFSDEMSVSIPGKLVTETGVLNLSLVFPLAGPPVLLNPEDTRELAVRLATIEVDY